MEPIRIDDFVSRVSLDRQDLLPVITDVQLVVGLRDLTKIANIMVMTEGYLYRLLCSVSLLGRKNVYPYRETRVEIRSMDPRGMAIGQTFVERPKILNFFERFGNHLQGHLINNGIVKLMPFIAFGTTTEGVPAMAHYLPPIVELRSSRVLIDGTHRSHMVMRVGTTIETIHIYGANEPLPCTPVRWNEVEVVDQKPPREIGFRDYQPEFFRDFKAIGIDG